jgi:ribulose-phosphate 3-epimerase
MAVERRQPYNPRYVVESRHDRPFTASRKHNALGHPMRLEIDGGVKAENIGDIARAGADTFVAGSAIFGSSDYAATIRAMRERIAR